MSEQNLRQADLSSLSVKQMTQAQRAELRRRFESFVTAYVGRNPATAPEPKKQVRKWTPGMKA